MAWASPLPLADRRRSGACPCTSRTGKLLLAHATPPYLGPALTSGFSLVAHRCGPTREQGNVVSLDHCRRSSSGWHGQAHCLLRTGGDPGLARARLARASCCLPMPPALSWAGSHQRFLTSCPPVWADPRTRKRCLFGPLSEELVWVAWASPLPLADRRRSGACPCTSRTGKLLLAHATRPILGRLSPAVSH